MLVRSSEFYESDAETAREKFSIALLYRYDRDKSSSSLRVLIAFIIYAAPCSSTRHGESHTARAVAAVGVIGRYQ